MFRRSHFLAFSTLGILTGAGAIAALYAGCSPSPGNGNDGGADAQPCAPGDTQCNQSCDPGTYGSKDCYTGPAGTNSKGICQTGKRSCNSNGTTSACIGEVTPQVEICNYVDDDCNNIIDDVAALVEAGVIANCNSPACLPNYDDAGITCWGPDFGICGAGTLSCAGGEKLGTPTGCSEFIHAGAPEVCNGIDDDCNGLIDDGITNLGACSLAANQPWSEFPDADLTNLGKLADGGTPKTVLGQCADAGSFACVDYNCGPHGCQDAGQQCAPSPPSTETCNGLDDDCNGIVDDHACKTDTFNPYCCDDGFGFFFCNSAPITGYTCKLAK